MVTLNCGVVPACMHRMCHAEEQPREKRLAPLPVLRHHGTQNVKIILTCMCRDVKARPRGPSSIGGHGAWLIVAASNRQENKSRQTRGLQKASDSAAQTLQATAQRAYWN